MHSVQDGAASKSYGLAVAALRVCQKRLLSAHGKNCVSWKDFAERRCYASGWYTNVFAVRPEETSPAVEALENLDPDSLTRVRRWNGFIA